MKNFSLVALHWEAFPEKDTFSVGHCPTKSEKSCPNWLQGGGGGSGVIWAMPKTRGVFFWERLPKLRGCLSYHGGGNTFHIVWTFKTELVESPEGAVLVKTFYLCY